MAFPALPWFKINPLYRRSRLHGNDGNFKVC